MATKEEIRHYVLEALKENHPMYYTEIGITRLIGNVMGGDGETLFEWKEDYEKLKNVLDELEQEGMINARTREDSEEKEYQYNSEMSHPVM